MPPTRIYPTTTYDADTGQYAPDEAPTAAALAALPQEIREYIDGLTSKLRAARITIREKDRLIAQVQSRADEATTNGTRHKRAKDRALRQLGEAEQILGIEQAMRQHAESTLVDLDRLRTTATVWRDARNGTPAKLKAFKDFCVALDSLPAPQDPPLEESPAIG